MRWLVIGVLVATFLWCDNSFLMGDQNLLLRMTTHHFFHAGFWHLLVNSFSTWVLLKRFCLKEFTIAWVIASLSYIFSPLPVIGFSNIIYALIGLRTPSFSSSWWKHPTTIVFFVATILMAFIPNISFVTHWVSLGLAIAVSALTRTIKQSIEDGARYLR